MTTAMRQSMRAPLNMMAQRKISLKYLIRRRNKAELRVGQNFERISNGLAGTPSEPLNVKLEQEKEGFTLRWDKPENDGGANINHYAVEYR